MVDKVAGVILAAGNPAHSLCAGRMCSEQPKVLHEVCGKPMLSYVIEAAQYAGAKPIYVVVGYESKVTARMGAAHTGEPRSCGREARLKDKSVHWVYQMERCGTGHALSMTSGSLAEFAGTILVLCGNTPLITPQTLQKLIHTHQANKDTACTILSCILNNPGGYSRILRNQTGQVTAIIEDANTNKEEKKIKEINSGIYVFNPSSIYPALKEIKPSQHKGRDEYYLTDVIPLLVKKGELVEVCLTENADECRGINSREELIMINRLMEQCIQHTLLEQGVTIIDPANTYIESNVSIGPDTIIYPFTVIRSGVRIGRHCEVGPFSHLRNGTVLEDYAEVGNFTETKKTKLGRHTKAKHLSYLGDTLIGNNVNIGAGTITANFDGKRKHQTIIEDGASTGSGTVLIAPVRMGKEAITGAGCVVPKGKGVPPGATVIGIPARPLKPVRPPTSRRGLAGGSPAISSGKQSHRPKGKKTRKLSHK